MIPLQPDAELRLVEPRPGPPPSLALRIERIWGELRSARPHLQDGMICTLEEASPSEIVVAPAPYRYFAAQRVDRELGAALGMVAVGVSGIVRSGSHVIVGRRAIVSDYQGYWELIPSGALPATSPAPDPLRQLSIELHEEAGIAPERIASIRILALVPDAVTQTADVCGRIDLGIQQGDLARIIASAPRSEYDDLRLLSEEELDSLRASLHTRMVPTSRRLLDGFRLDIWGNGR